MLIRSTVFGASLLIAAGTAIAHEDNVENTGGAYVGSGTGNVLTTGLDTCLRAGTFSEDEQINACEGIEEVVEEVEEEAPVEVVEAPEPEPTSRTETIALVRNANFETDSATLTPEGRSVIVGAMDELASLDDIGSLTVIGYTDSRGSEAYNQGLSERRAQTVADLLQTRFPNADMKVVGLGESNPVGDNNTAEGRLANRRVEVIFDGTRVIFN